MYHDTDALYYHPVVAQVCYFSFICPIKLTFPVVVYACIPTFESSVDLCNLLDLRVHLEPHHPLEVLAFVGMCDEAVVRSLYLLNLFLELKKDVITWFIPIFINKFNDFLMTFPYHIWTFLECHRDLKPPDPLFCSFTPAAI